LSRKCRKFPANIRVQRHCLALFSDHAWSEANIMKELTGSSSKIFNPCRITNSARIRFLAEGNLATTK
jgi:hypothetical protein